MSCASRKTERTTQNWRQPNRCPQATLGEASDEGVRWRTESVQKYSVAVDGPFCSRARCAGFAVVCGGWFARELLPKRRRKLCPQRLPIVARFFVSFLVGVNACGTLRPDTSEFVLDIARPNRRTSMQGSGTLGSEIRIAHQPGEWDVVVLVCLLHVVVQHRRRWLRVRLL